MSQSLHADVLGWRRKIGVVVPATNTIVEPEFHQMAPEGITNHTNRFQLSNMSLNSDADFLRMVREIEANLDVAIDGLVPAAPDHIIIGISAESFWDGADGAAALKERLSQRAGVPITLGSDAVRLAITTVNAQRIAVLTPYWPIADERVCQYFGQCGLDVRRIIGLKATSQSILLSRAPTRWNKHWMILMATMSMLSSKLGRILEWPKSLQPLNNYLESQSLPSILRCTGTH